MKKLMVMLLVMAMGAYAQNSNDAFKLNDKGEMARVYTIKGIDCLKRGTPMSDELLTEIRTQWGTKAGKDGKHRLIGENIIRIEWEMVDETDPAMNKVNQHIYIQTQTVREAYVDEVIEYAKNRIAEYQKKGYAVGVYICKFSNGTSNKPLFVFGKILNGKIITGGELNSYIDAFDRTQRQKEQNDQKAKKALADSDKSNEDPNDIKLNAPVNPKEK